MDIEISSWSSCGAVLLYKLLKIPAEETGKIIGDYLRYYRLVNLEKLNQKYQRRSNERNLDSENIRPVSPKLGIPLLEAASIEDDDTLQEVWATLLVNAVDCNFRGEIRTAFINIIKTLTPIDIKILDELRKYLQSAILDSNTRIPVHIDKNIIMQRLNIDRMTCDAALDNLERCMLLASPELPTRGSADKDYIFKELTALGILFIRACVDLPQSQS